MSFAFTMIIGTIVVPAAVGLGLLFLSVKLTVLIETPIIVRFGVTQNRRYIEGVNTLTNALFNMILACLVYSGLFMNAVMITTVFYALAELVLIPVSEAFAYKRMSSQGTLRILLASYAANFLSCAVGLALSALLLFMFGLWPRGVA